MNISRITYCRGVCLVTLRNVPCDSRALGEIFTSMSESGINVDMISQTAPMGDKISVAFTISINSMVPLMPLIHGLKGKYPALSMELSTGMTKLNFFDEHMVHTPGVAAHVFTMLARENIRVTMITTSELDISLLVQEHEDNAALHLCQEEYGVVPEETEFI